MGAGSRHIHRPWATGNKDMRFFAVLQIKGPTREKERLNSENLFASPLVRLGSSIDDLGLARLEFCVGEIPAMGVIADN